MQVSLNKKKTKAFTQKQKTSHFNKTPLNKTIAREDLQHKTSLCHHKHRQPKQTKILNIKMVFIDMERSVAHQHVIY